MLDKILKIVNPVLVAAVVFFAVAIFYQGVEYRLNIAAMNDFQAGRGSSERSGKSRGTEASGAAARFSEYKIISGRNLFDARTDRKSEDEDLSGPDIKEMEKTQLDLRLWGTIAGSKGYCYAVIENKSERKQQLYRVGDRIEQARIKMILRKRVVLEVNGKDEVLEIEDLVEESSRTSGRGRRSEMSGGSGAGGTNIEIERERISEALQDINNLMRQVRVRPYFEQGQPAGIMLSGIRRDSIFEEMGLKSGDVIKTANGRRIRSMDDAMAFYEDLSSAGRVELEIQRDGSRQRINYTIE